MADSTDVQLVAWDNERARPLADQLTAARYAITAYKADYAADGINAKAITAGANNIADGYATDGRAPITGNSITNMKAALDQLDTALNTTLVSGVGLTVAAILDAIQVNGSPRGQLAV